MTSSLHHDIRRRAFTLIELMVVIGIVVLLIAFAVPMISRAHKAAVRNAMAADLAIIANGLEAYKADFGDYPRCSSTQINNQPVLGAALLCWAVVAPGPANADAASNTTGDGADGPGFRVRGTTGTVKGPYLPVDRFTFGVYTQIQSQGLVVGGTVVPQVPSATTFIQDNVTMIADRYMHPILYFPANKAADPFAAVPGGAYINTQPRSTTGSSNAMFNYTDNNEALTQGSPSLLSLDLKPNKLSWQVMCFRLGLTSLPVPSGTCQTADAPLSTGPYLLWCAGNDGIFGSNDDLANSGSDVQLNTSRVPSTFAGADPNPDVQ